MFWIISRSVLLTTRNVSDKLVKKIKPHISCSMTFFSFFRKSSLFEIMYKNSAEPDRPQLTILRMRSSCWLPKATNINSEYTLLLLFPCNHGCTNFSQWRVIRTWPVLFTFNCVSVRAIQLSCTYTHKFLFFPEKDDSFPTCFRK